MRFFVAALFALFLLFPVTHSAQAMQGHVYTDGLTDEQEAEINLKVKQLITQNKVSEVNTPLVTPQTLDNIAKYSEIGTSIGKGLAGAAKELGVAVNDFAATPVGKMTMFLVVWSFFGHALVHVIGGFILFVVLTSIWLYSFRRFCILDRVTVTPVPGTWRVKKEVIYVHANASAVGLYAFLLAAIIAICSIVTFSG